MALDPRYVASSDLQQYLVDKDTGLPLAGGLVYFWSDTGRYTVAKDVYMLSGNPPNYSFVPLPNPIVLSSVGTIQDNNGNDVIPYYLPIVSEDDPTVDLYFVVVQNAQGVPQFTREAWPPNAVETSTPVDASNLFNYVPNGQFLLHNSINPEEDFEIPGGSTAIAPGGWTFELPDNPASSNQLIFTQLNTWTDNPAQSPPFEANIICTSPSGADNEKALRLKFNDVNKFSNNQTYTFGFNGVANTSVTDITVRLVKYFGVGGTVFTPVNLATFTINNEPNIYYIAFSFGNNEGDTIGTGQTYVALELSFNTNQSFNVSLTNFALVDGNVILTGYPVQTNADTVARGLFGWCDVPDYTGRDLYLPPVVTPYGMKFDHTIIGRIDLITGDVVSPNSVSPLPNGNIMPMDGATYLYSNFSAIDIPYARIGDYFLENSAVPNIPMFGTGANYATAYAFAGLTDAFRITVNSNGAGISGASDGVIPTGFTFVVIPQYDASTTGSASLGYQAYTNIANTLLAVADFTVANDDAGANTSGFTVTTLDEFTSIVAQQAYALNVLTTDGNALANPGMAGKYWTFSDSDDSEIDYYMWFFFTNETDPAPSDRVPIRMNMDSNYTAQDVNNLVREAMSAYQITSITVTGVPDPGSYFLFSTNPGTPVNYYVWYRVDGAGTDPGVSGRIGIVVDIEADFLEAEIVTATLIAINKYQFQAPYAPGMFFRNRDFGGVYDKDVLQRWSLISGLSGAEMGTFEFQQILAHTHGAAFRSPAAFTEELISGENDINQGITGGTETRPVNLHVTACIRY